MLCGMRIEGTIVHQPGKSAFIYAGQFHQSGKILWTHEGRLLWQIQRSGIVKNACDKHGAKKVFFAIAFHSELAADQSMDVVAIGSTMLHHTLNAVGDIFVLLFVELKGVQPAGDVAVMIEVSAVEILMDEPCWQRRMGIPSREAAKCLQLTVKCERHMSEAVSGKPVNHSGKQALRTGEQYIDVRHS